MRSNKQVEELRYMMVSSGAVSNSGIINLGGYSVRTFHISMTQEMYPVSTLVVWSLDPMGKMAVQQLTFPVFKAKVGYIKLCSSPSFFTFSSDFF